MCAEEYPARQLALTGPLLGLNATAARSEGAGDASEGGGLWVRYFGPQPSLVEEDGEETQVGPGSAECSARVCVLTGATIWRHVTTSRAALLLDVGVVACMAHIPLPPLLQGSRQHLAAVTHWVAADVCSRQGLRLVAAALQYRSSNGRLAVLVNSAGAGAAAASAEGAREQRLAPIERLLVAVSSGLLQTGGQPGGVAGWLVLGMGWWRRCAQHLNRI